MEPLPIEQDWIELEWVRCRHWIDAALDRGPGTHIIEDIEAGIADNTLQFWPGKNGAVITEIRAFPRKKVINVFLCAGDWRECLEIGEKYIKPWALENGCHAVIQQGRKGWLRLLPKFGWKPLHYTMTKELR